MKRVLGVVMLSVLLVLSGCGGGGSDDADNDGAGQTDGNGGDDTEGEGEGEGEGKHAIKAELREKACCYLTIAPVIEIGCRPATGRLYLRDSKR